MIKTTYEIRYLPLFYRELERDISHIAFKLLNPDAANNLLDDVESAIIKRLEDGPEAFEKIPTKKKRRIPYYRIYVKKYIIYYVVLEENGKKIMEIRRFLHVRENRDKKI